MQHNFELQISRLAQQQTDTNRINRANCMKDPFRTAASCMQQYPDVSQADLWDTNQIPMTVNYVPSGFQSPYTEQQYQQTFSGGAVYQGPNLISGQQQQQTPPVQSTQFSPVATFRNLTNPGVRPRVGDQWQVSIVRGRPGATVSASSSQNGHVLGSATMGTLNSNGEWVKTGSFDDSTVGTWNEVWYVDGVKAGEFNFVVASGSGSGTGIDNNTTDQGGNEGLFGGGSGSGSGSHSGGGGSIAGMFAGISPNMLLIGGAAILAVLVLKK